MYAVGGILAFVLTITVIILLMNRSNPSEQNDVIASREHSSEVPAPLADIDSTSTVAAPTTASVQIIRDPRDFLVLFGYRNPAEDIPPIVITVGWLADSHTIVVPAEIVRGLEGALAEAEQQGTALKLCALPGAPVDIASWSYPAKCPEVCLMRTQDPVSPVEDVVNQITKSGAARIGQLAERDGVISHCSYEFLPRSTGLNQPLVSLVSYTPGMSRQKLQATQVSLELSPQGTLGWIGEPVESDESPLERGGLIVDSENMILAMCLPTGELVWSDTLLKALPTSRQ